MTIASVYTFSPFAVPVAVTAFLVLALGSIVFWSRRSRVSALFFTMTTVAFLWLFAFTFMYMTRDAALALRWARLAYLGVPFIAPAIYTFTVAVLQIEERRKLAVGLAWTIALVASTLALTTDLLVRGVVRYWWGFYPVYTVSVGVPFVIYFFGYLIAALVEFVRAFPASSGIERKRIRLLIVGFAIAYAGCVDYLPKYGLAVYPFGYLPILVFVFIVARAVRKYDLVAITPSFAAPEIIGTMADALFVCDRDQRIQVVNPAAESLLGYPASELHQKPIDELLLERADSPLIEALRSGTVRTGDECVFVDRLGRPIDLTVSVAPLVHEGETAGAVIIGRDTRELKRAAVGRDAALTALRQSELRYRLLFEQNAAGVCVMSADGVMTDCNATFASITGYDRRALLGRNLRELYAATNARDPLSSLVRSGTNSSEVDLMRKDGTTCYLLQNLVQFGEGKTAVIHATVVDISERKLAEERIEFRAYHDVLTNLPNRKLFVDRLQQKLARGKRSGRTIAVMFIDIDRFKSVNDMHGHPAGDELLLILADRLRGCIRAEDTVARIGGDEFTIMVSELRHPEDAASVAEKILESLQRPVDLTGSITVEVTASIGIAIAPVDGTDPESLLRHADGAMYRAKEAGRNNYQLCTEEMKQRAIVRLTLEAKLRRAVAEKQFVLLYQPQVDLVSGAIVGVEALIRWNDPERGMVDPATFIPVAEDSRLILPIGDWVLGAACAQMKQWHQEGVPIPRVAVNLSARQFQQQNLVDSVRNALRDAELEPALLELEITETTAMQNAQATVEVLRNLRALGVRVSIDDFGTGYSSLDYLKRFPIDAIKIDRTFVRDISSNDSDLAIVSAVIGIARSLGLGVVAEGVETAEQVSVLRQYGCLEAQGYYFSRPVPPESIAALVTGQNALDQELARISHTPSAAAADGSLSASLHGRFRSST
jgi:diguanylate cyclase (GGDEF)-like protein/PAS domain S-box-containing protein